MYTTSLVYSIIGEASDARKCSPLPMPITNGLPFLAATIVVLLITFLNKKLYGHWKNIKTQSWNIQATILMGIIFGPVLGVSFSLTSIQYINVAVAQTIFALVPVMALLIAHFVYKEKITKYAMAGVLVAIAGVAILIWRIKINTLLDF